MTDTLRHLEALGIAHREAREAADYYMTRRDSEIRRLLKERLYTKAQIASLTGLTRQRIQQISEEE